MLTWSTNVNLNPFLLSSKFSPGVDCELASNFTKAANMHNFQALLHGCKAQLKNGKDVNFDKSEDGFGMKKSMPLWWASDSDDWLESWNAKRYQTCEHLWHPLTSWLLNCNMRLIKSKVWQAADG